MTRTDRTPTTIAKPDANGSLFNPWVFQSASLLVHICSVGIVFAILRRFFENAPAFVGTVVVATITFVLAMLSQPSAVALPLEALVVDVVLMGTRWRKSLACLSPWFALAIPIASIAQHVQPCLWLVLIWKAKDIPRLLAGPSLTREWAY